MDNPNLLSPSVLCFVGDAVYGLYVTMNLNRCKGFTQIELIHLDGISCRIMKEKN